jgi:hypothetical protein
MKFNSRKDTLFTCVVFGSIAVLIAVTMLDINANGLNIANSWKYILNAIIALFLLWLFYDTRYEITKDTLKYKSGPIKGKIAIQEITQIVCGKTLWVGMRPATAKNALIITYKKYNEVYISPSSNELFVHEILKHNSAIEIIQSSN